jgi:hypothetical protein
VTNSQRYIFWWIRGRISEFCPRSSETRNVKRFNLQTASGSSIKVLGERLLRLNIGLRREFTWTFLIADVTDAILRADFLDNFKLTVDISGKRLIDSETWLAVQCPLKQTNPQTIRAVFTNAADAYQQLLRQFPNVLRSSNVPTKPHHTVLHYIETKGPQHTIDRGDCPRRNTSWPKTNSRISNDRA